MYSQGSQFMDNPKFQTFFRLLLGSLNRMPARGPVIMYTSYHDATTVMTNCTLFHKNVALHATMVPDVTIVQTDITIAAPW